MTYIIKTVVCDHFQIGNACLRIVEEAARKHVTACPIFNTEAP